ncbi:MAG UNVERIFIED_CONTAM: S1 RNA-binding domain-containing protein [Anaerolineae bacterium]|jgi:hypothetical protein
MHAVIGLDTFSSELDFAALLDATFDNTKVERGDIIEGVILAIDNQGLIVDVNLMRDGIVPRRDLERLDPLHNLKSGRSLTYPSSGLKMTMATCSFLSHKPNKTKTGKTPNA